MPVNVTGDMTPKNGSLVVCDGTLAANKVEQMGPGFNLFCALFSNNVSCNAAFGGWQAELQQKLDAHYVQKQPMPAYVRLAEQNSLIGGIATVPSRKLKITNTVYHTTFSNDDGYYEIQYKLAITSAISDARALSRPLFLQPLGIDADNWNPVVAARLFAGAIITADQNDEINITVPINSNIPGSNHQIFKATLIEEMAKQRQALLDGDKPKGSSQQNNVAYRTTLSNIIGTLTTNIETKQNGRLTSGSNSKKVKELKRIQAAINQEAVDELNNGQYQNYRQQILAACQIKRHSWRFWSTPHSVNEWHALEQVYLKSFGKK